MTNSEDERPLRSRRRRRIIIEEESSDEDEDDGQVDVGTTTGGGFKDDSHGSSLNDDGDDDSEGEEEGEGGSSFALDDVDDGDYEEGSSSSSSSSSSSRSSSVDGGGGSRPVMATKTRKKRTGTASRIIDDDDHTDGGGDTGGFGGDEEGTVAGDDDETVTLSDSDGDCSSLAHASVVSSPEVHGTYRGGEDHAVTAIEVDIVATSSSSEEDDEGSDADIAVAEAEVVGGYASPNSSTGRDSDSDSLVEAFADLDIRHQSPPPSPSALSPIDDDADPNTTAREDPRDGEGSEKNPSPPSSGSSSNSDTSGSSLVDAFADLEIRQSPSKSRSSSPPSPPRSGDDTAQPNTGPVRSSGHPSPPSSSSSVRGGGCSDDDSSSSSGSNHLVVEGRRLLFEDDDDDDDDDDDHVAGVVGSTPPSPPECSSSTTPADETGGGEEGSRAPTSVVRAFTPPVEGGRGGRAAASAPAPTVSSGPSPPPASTTTQVVVEGTRMETKDGPSSFDEASTPSALTGTNAASICRGGTTPPDDGWTFDATTSEYALLNPDGRDGTGAGTGTPEGRCRFRIPAELYVRLYEHQREGVRWLMGLYASGVGGVLGDDMGMGKTFQTLVLLGGLMRARSIRNALVMCPVSLLRTWQREAGDILKSCCTKVSIIVASSDVPKPKRLNMLRQAITCSARRPHLVITTYGLAGTSPDDLIPRDYNGGETSWDYVILDEGHKIKNPSTKVNKGCHRICRSSSTKTTITHRLLLTGTPIQNNLKELWALFDWATAGTLLGKLPRFLDRFAAPIEQGRHKNATTSALRTAEKANRELQDLLRPHFLQRFKKSVFAGKLPSKTECVVWTHLSSRQRAMYEHFIGSGHVAAVLSGETSSPLVAVTWLKKLCGHPSLLSAGDMQRQQTNAMVERNISRDQLIKDSSKLLTLVSLIEHLRGAGHRMLIFSQSTKMLDIIQMVLRPLKLSRIDGTTREKDRQGTVDDFNREGSDIVAILLSTKAAGLGLTLTGADRAVIYDPSWNPADDSQAVDRCYRIGTTKPVTVYRLIAAGTVEERMYEKQVHKDGIRRTLLTNAGNATERYFDKSELQRLFELSPPGVCSVLEKVKVPKEGVGKCEGTHAVGRSSFIESVSGVVGISSHDHLYTETVVDVEDRNVNNAILQSPFARTPCKKPKYGKARRVLAECNRGVLASMENCNVARENDKRASSQQVQVVGAQNHDCNNNEKSVIQVSNSLVEENIVASDTKSDADYNSSQVRVVELLRRVDALSDEHQMEEKMGLLLDALEIGPMDKQQKIAVHKQIASVAKALQWL